ncbi:MAG: LiaF transmembrane domain-containing protein [Chitinophagales bacterium]
MSGRRERREQRRAARGPLGGVLLVLAGVVLLLANLGYLTDEFWEMVFRFWPLLLVVIGLDFLTRGSRWAWVGPTLAVLLLAAALSVLFWSPVDRQFKGRRPGAAAEGAARLREPLPSGLNLARYKVSFGATDFRVSAGNGHDLYRVSRGEGTTGEFYARTTVSDGVARVRLYQPNLGAGQWRGVHSAWNLTLPTTIPIELEVNGGAGTLSLDLSQLRAERVDVRVAAGQASLRLGDRAAEQSVRVAAAAGKVELQVPRRAGLRIVTRGILGKEEFQRAGLEQVAGAWVTPDREKAPARIEADLTTVAGKVALDLY